MSGAPIDAPNPGRPELDDDEAMPRPPMARRSVLLGLVFIVVLVAFL